MSTAYHPQTDGASEQSNQEIEAYLAIFCANNPEQWSRLISIMEFSYNQKLHAPQTTYLIMESNPRPFPLHSPAQMYQKLKNKSETYKRHEMKQ